MAVARDDTATDAWLAREGSKDGAPLVDRIGLDDTLSDQQRHILRAKIAARESAEESRRYATVKGLDDQVAKATSMIATEPSGYRIGTLSALADGYDAAGAMQRGSETRRIARLEPFFLSFAQLGPAGQQRHLEALSAPERTFGEAILRHQANLSADGETREGNAALSDARRASDDTQIAQAAPDEPTATSAPRRGIAPATEPPSNDPATEKAFQDFEGEHLLLSNGKWVVDPNSPTGYVLTPSNDLKNVVAAARQAKADHPDWKLSDDLALLSKKTRDELEALLRANLGQGGTFDYQRRHYAPGKDGFTQLRQFRSIANINVGLFCQQLGLSLRETLGLAGLYAVKNSNNRNLLNLPYVLDTDTEKYIRIGYEIGEKKLF